MLSIVTEKEKFQRENIKLGAGLIRFNLDTSKSKRKAKMRD